MAMRILAMSLAYVHIFTSKTVVANIFRQKVQDASLVHAFYYLWYNASDLLYACISKHLIEFFCLRYGNPETDGKYLHWDHAVIFQPSSNKLILCLKRMDIYSPTIFAGTPALE